MGIFFYIFSSSHIVVYPCDIKLFFRQLVYSQAHRCRGGGVQGWVCVCVYVCVFLLQQNWSRCSFSTLIFVSEALSYLNVSFNKCLSGFGGFLVIQWLRLRVWHCRGCGLISGWETKIPHAVISAVKNFF